MLGAASNQTPVEIVRRYAEHFERSTISAIAKDWSYVEVRLIYYSKDVLTETGVFRKQGLMLRKCGTYRKQGTTRGQFKESGMMCCSLL